MCCSINRAQLHTVVSVVSQSKTRWIRRVGLDGGEDLVKVEIAGRVVLGDLSAARRNDSSRLSLIHI